MIANVIIKILAELGAVLALFGVALVCGMLIGAVAAWLKQSVRVAAILSVLWYIIKLPFSPVRWFITKCAELYHCKCAEIEKARYDKYNG